MLKGETVHINGDGETSRDFCYIDNTVQANILAGTCQNKDSLNQIYNIAVGERTSLNQLFQFLQSSLVGQGVSYTKLPVYGEFRAGDVLHSQASINKARNLLGYQPTAAVVEGLSIAMPWYRNKLAG